MSKSFSNILKSNQYKILYSLVNTANTNQLKTIKPLINGYIKVASNLNDVEYSNKIMNLKKLVYSKERKPVNYSSKNVKIIKKLQTRVRNIKYNRQQLLNLLFEDAREYYENLNSSNGLNMLEELESFYMTYTQSTSPKYFGFCKPKMSLVKYVHLLENIGRRYSRLIDEGMDPNKYFSRVVTAHKCTEQRIAALVHAFKERNYAGPTKVIQKYARGFLTRKTLKNLKTKNNLIGLNRLPRGNVVKIQRAPGIHNYVAKNSLSNYYKFKGKSLKTNNSSNKNTGVTHPLTRAPIKFKNLKTVYNPYN